MKPRARKRIRQISQLLAISCIFAAAALLQSCATTPPSDINNACSIFKDKPDWYKAARKSQQQWGTPVQVQMAIIRQESSFRDDAQPERSRLLGVIPWTRPSSAYGYPQAKDDTWDWYIEKTGNRGADRDDFADATDFVGWYTNYSQQTLGISKWDAYNQYLAYHEGHGGYQRGSYNKKSWLKKVARNVDQQAKRYSAQLKTCENELDKGWSIWPF
ncbi:MAG: transglycosylase SLT domain-containing protein [bacterium]